MPKKNLYDVNSMESAINEVKSNKMSLRAAAKKYGVPKSTLDFKLKNPGHKDTCGPSPILSLREESELVIWIQELANRGFPRKKEDILNCVQEFLLGNPRPNPFKNHRPGDCWFKAFLRRHPTIVQRTSEAVSSASACVSEANIKKWFNEIKGYLETKNITMDDPSRIYNGDETGFQICPSTGKVFAGKGTKNVYTVDKGSPKENLTVMFSFSASGITCPPMIIYPYKRIPEKISVTVNSAWGIGRSDNGWMTAETFYDYIKNIFYPHLIENNIQFPVILFLDGHKSHLTYELSLLCNKLNMEVIALYPNATRIIQPCDVAVFRPIKIGWKKAVREFYERNPGQVLNKITFAPLLEQVVNNVVKPETLQNGFKACGLFPFNSNAIDFSKCLGKTNKSVVEVANENPVSMEKKTFVNFIDNEIITKFKSFDTILIKEDFNNEFLTLHQIWKYFGKPEKEENKGENNEQFENIQVMDSETESNKPGNELVEQDTELENHDTELKEQNTNLKDAIINLEESGIDLKDSETPKNKKNNVENVKNTFKLDPTAMTTNFKKIHVIENIIIERIDAVAATATSLNTNLLCTSNYFENIKLPPQILQVSSKAKNVDLSLPSTSKTCISDFLKIPDQPQRKNKRDVERVSFAITSRAYQENFESKRAIKLAEENKKMERKRLREEKAAAKSNSGNKKVRKSTDSIKDHNDCFVCKKRLYKSSHYVVCNNCKNCFHLHCVPNKHKKHIPDLEDVDLFMCHTCYNEESDDEASDSEASRDKDTDESEEEKEDNAKREDTEAENKNENNLNEESDEVEQKIDENEEIEIDQLFKNFRDEYAKLY